VGDDRAGVQTGTELVGAPQTLVAILVAESLATTSSSVLHIEG